MPNKCDNPYIQAIIEIVSRTEQIRFKKGFASPRTTVECRDGTVEITRRIYLDESPDLFEVFVSLVLDDKVDFSATFSGRAGIFLRANDVEEFHIKLIKFSQLTPVLFALYGWVASIDPHGEYTYLPPVHPIPLYIVRKETLERTSPKTFGSNFLQALRDLDSAILAMSPEQDDTSINDEIDFTDDNDKPELNDEGDD